jgi:hypothetical protein
MVLPERITHAISKTYVKATELEKAMDVNYKGNITIEYKNHTTKSWYAIDGTLKEHLHKIASTIVLFGKCKYRITECDS